MAMSFAGGLRWRAPLPGGSAGIRPKSERAMNFNIGDIVQLKSGGRGLTVVKQTGDQVELVWYAENDDTLHTGTVPAGCLALIEFDDDEEDLDDDD
jgi:uncharacterized protein YodC (DUF2158 family)